MHELSIARGVIEARRKRLDARVMRTSKPCISGWARYPAPAEILAGSELEIAALELAT